MKRTCRLIGLTTPSKHPHACDALAPTMRAIVQDRYGDSDTLQLRDVVRPDPGPNQVLIKVAAAGVDRAVWHLMLGTPYLVRAVFGLRRPKRRSPGLDVCGRVVCVGAGVSELHVGDNVFGVGIGTFAEYALADQNRLTHRPPELDETLAAALPISGITALQAVFDMGQLKRGQHVLIIGASGGVGSYAVQMACSAGAVVTGVASLKKLSWVRSLGATHTIDYASREALESAQRYDLVIDIGGRASIRRLRRVLTPRGTLVIVGGEGGDKLTGGLFRLLHAMALSLFVKQRLTTFVAGESTELLTRLRDWVLSEPNRSVVTERYDLESAPQAIADLAAGRIAGKAVICVVRSEPPR